MECMRQFQRTLDDCVAVMPKRAVCVAPSVQYVLLQDTGHRSHGGAAGWYVMAAIGVDLKPSCMLVPHGPSAGDRDSCTGMPQLCGHKM